MSLGTLPHPDPVADGQPEPQDHKRNSALRVISFIVAIAVILGFALYEAHARTQPAAVMVGPVNPDYVTPPAPKLPAFTPDSNVMNGLNTNAAAAGDSQTCNTPPPASSIYDGRTVILRTLQTLHAGLAGNHNCIGDLINMSELTCGGCTVDNIPGLPYGAADGAIQLQCWGLVDLVGNPDGMGYQSYGNLHTFDADYTVGGHAYSVQVGLVNPHGGTWQAQGLPGFNHNGSARNQLGSANCGH